MLGREKATFHSESMQMLDNKYRTLARACHTVPPVTVPVELQRHMLALLLAEEGQLSSDMPIPSRRV